MIVRNDFNEHSFEQLIRTELIEQMVDLEFSADGERDSKLLEAFKHVIAYNSVPGEFEEGKYDL